MYACPAVQDDIKAVLEILLDAYMGVPTDKWHECVAEALQLRDAESGLTVLGQAVVKGDNEAVPPLLDAVR